MTGGPVTVVSASPGRAVRRAVGAYVVAAGVLVVAYLPACLWLYLVLVEDHEEGSRAAAAGAPHGWAAVLPMAAPAVLWMVGAAVGVVLLLRRLRVPAWRTVGTAAVVVALSTLAAWYVATSESSGFADVSGWAGAAVAGAVLVGLAGGTLVARRASRAAAVGRTT